MITKPKCNTKQEFMEIANKYTLIHKVGQLCTLALQTTNKMCMVATLLDRAYKICNSWKLIHENFERITKVLQNKLMFQSFIDSQI